MIYVLTDGLGNYKIGVTDDPVAERRAELQTGNAHDLTPVMTLVGGQPLERQLHRRFEPKRIKNRREWFKLDAADLAEISAWVCPHCGGAKAWTPPPSVDHAPVNGEFAHPTDDDVRELIGIIKKIPALTKFTLSKLMVSTNPRQVVGELPLFFAKRGYVCGGRPAALLEALDRFLIPYTERTVYFDEKPFYLWRCAGNRIETTYNLVQQLPVSEPVAF